MDLENRLIKTSIKFENMDLRGKLIQISYFLLHFMFSIPILITLFDIHSAINRGLDFQSNWQNALNTMIKQGRFITSMVIFGLIVSLIIGWYFMSQSSHALYLKVVGLFLIFSQVVSNGICQILIEFSINSSSSALLIGLSVISLILIFVHSWIIEHFWITFSFTSQNLFVRKNSNKMLILNTILKVTFMIKCVLDPTINNNKQIRIQQNSIKFIVIVLTICKIQENYYINEISNKLSVFGTTFGFVIISMSFLAHVINQPLVVDNQIIVSIIVGIFAITSVSVYFQNIQAQMDFKTFQEISENDQIIKSLENSFKMWKNYQNSKKDQIIFSSIKKSHMFNCSNPSCYCRKQNLDSGDLNQTFFKEYLNEMAQYFSQQITTERISILLLNFQLEIFNNPLIVARKVKALKFQYQNSLEINLGLQKLDAKLADFISQKNSKMDSINFQLPAKLDEVLFQLENIIISEVQTKNHKWQYLCQILIKSLEIEEDIVKQIANISNFEMIFHQNKFMLRKSLSFNALCLFYYSEVVFFKKQVTGLEENLKEIKAVLNYNFILNSRDMAKNIFDSRCGLLEIDLSQCQINEEFNFRITSCNRNALQIFGHSKDTMINQKLQQFYPGFMWDSIKPIFISYLKQNEQSQTTPTLETYFLDKNNNVFKALKCFNVVTKPSGIYLMILLFEKEASKIVLLDENSLIENVGNDYKKYFGFSYKKIPFECLFYLEDQFHSLTYQDKMQQNVAMIYGTQIGKEFRLYQQKVKNIAEMKMKKSNRVRFQTLRSIGTKKRLQQNLSMQISQERQKLMGFKISSESSHERSEKIIDDKSKSVLTVAIQCKKRRLGELNFIQVSLEAFKRRKPPRYRKKTIIIRKLIQAINPDLSPQHIDFDDEKKWQDEVKQLDKDTLQIDDDYEPTSIFDEKQIVEQNLKQNNILIENSSVQSSIRGDSVAFFYQNFIDICFKLFQHPQEITDRRLNRFTFFSILLCLLISVLVVGTYEVFNLGLYQIRDIFFADGAVSDNMQLSEFLYNRAMNFKQYKDDPISFEDISQSSYFQRQYLFGLLKFDMQSMPTEVTKMTNTRFYQYLIVPVKWYEAKNTFTMIQSGQMIEFYVYLSKLVQRDMLSDNAESKQLVENNLKLMWMNFPQLKRINHYNLSLYKDMSDQSISLINMLIYLLGLGHFLLSATILCFFYWEKVFRRKQQVQGYSIYKLIPRKIIEILSYYYQNLALRIKQTSDLLPYETHFERQGIYLPTDGSAFLKSNNSTFVTNNFKSPMAIWKMVFVLLLINSIYAAILIDVSRLSGPIDKMMNNVNDLMDSENYLLEAYFDLKAKFIIEEKYDVDPAFFDDLLLSQQSNQVIFSMIAVQSLNLFANYDQTYTKQFIDLLIKNICQLAKNDITPEQYQKCKSYFKLNMIDSGVITGMNFFTRKIKETILMFKQKFMMLQNNTVSEEEKQKILATFKELDFREIDESIIYMFKMFQSTQSRIYLSLEKTIISLLKFSLAIVIIEIIIIGLGYPIVLIWNFKNEKKQLSKIYVSFLLIPTPVSKMIKAFAGKIEQVLQIDKNFD